MNKATPSYLESILRKLAQECQQAIGARVDFDRTPGKSEYHFVIPDSSPKKRIAGGGYNVRHSRRHDKQQPCAIVAVDACLLDDTDTEYIGRYFCKANRGGDNRGEVHVATCRIGDSDYVVARTALIEAATNLLSGKRYPW